MSGSQAGALVSMAPSAAAVTASLAGYGWALWLATPVVATGVAAVVSWWRGRVPRTASPERAAQEHQRYLDALGRASAQAPAAHPPAAASPQFEPHAHDSVHTVTVLPGPAGGGETPAV